MSYLDVPRIHILGEFYANPSTINNDPDHYKVDNTSPSPWQTPDGDHQFYFAKASITSAIGPQGPVSSDPILGADFSSNKSGRLVDLDVYQQAVTTMFGMEIVLQVGATTITGTMDPAILHGWWDKSVMPTRGWRPIDTYGQASYGGDANSAGSFVTRIRFPAEKWPSGVSATLDALKAAQVGDDDVLAAFRFALDGYQNVEGQEGFLRGRMSGVLGPVLDNEPAGLLARRWLNARPDPQPTDHWNIPAFYGLPFTVDKHRQKLVIDMGNGMPSVSSGGPPVDVGELTVMSGSATVASFQYNEFTLNSSAGIVELSIPSDLQQQILTTPLSINTSRTDIGAQNLFSEASDGVYLACDNRVARLTPNAHNPQQWPASAQGQVYVTQFGEPMADVALTAAVIPVHGSTPGATVPGTTIDASGKRVNPYYEGDTPQADGAVVATVGKTDINGVASLVTEVVRDPGSRTPQLDGQMYFVYPLRSGEDLDGVLQERQVSILAWSEYTVQEHPAWSEVEAMMAPYAKLYPHMTAKIDLAEKATFEFYSHNPPWALAYKAKPKDGFENGAIPYFMTLDFLHGLYMPITRDLSPNKVQTVLNFCRDVQKKAGQQSEEGE